MTELSILVAYPVVRFIIIVSLSCVKISVANAKNTAEFTLALYLDLAKAFDSINHDLLLHKLYMIGIRDMYLKWLQSYMSDRKQVVVNGDHKSSEHRGSHRDPH